MSNVRVLKPGQVLVAGTDTGLVIVENRNGRAEVRHVDPAALVGVPA